MKQQDQPSSAQAEKPKPPWRIRLTSWKWWVYGDAYSQPLEQLPKGFYKHVAFATTLWVVIAFHPWVTTFINREPPPFDQLKVVEGTIHTTYEKKPARHLQDTRWDEFRDGVSGFFEHIGQTSPLGKYPQLREIQSKFGWL